MSIIFITVKKYIAYCRVSTKDQNLGLDAQLDIIKIHIEKKGGTLISQYSEHESGKKDARQKLEIALNECKKSGATLIVAKLDRLSRSVQFLFKLRDSGVDFEVCDLPELNTLTLSMFAQSERELISTRTKEALKALKAKGVKLGNPRINEIDRDKAIKAANMAVKAKAADNYNNKKAFEVIYSARQLGKNWAEISRQLEAAKFETSKGSHKWSLTQVQRIYYRYAEK